MTRKKRPVIILVLASIILAVQIYDIDYNDLSWNMNTKNYLRILSIILIIAGVIIDNLQAKKANK
jgi:uncharacterized membrane protein